MLYTITIHILHTTTVPNHPVVDADIHTVKSLEGGILNTAVDLLN